MLYDGKRSRLSSVVIDEFLKKVNEKIREKWCFLLFYDKEGDDFLTKIVTGYET